MIIGLVGAGIGESLSPALHEREAAHSALDYSYRLFDLDELGRPPPRWGRWCGRRTSPTACVA